MSSLPVSGMWTPRKYLISVGSCWNPRNIYWLLWCNKYHTECTPHNLDLIKACVNRLRSVLFIERRKEFCFLCDIFLISPSCRSLNIESNHNWGEMWKGNFSHRTEPSIRACERSRELAALELNRQFVSKEKEIPQKNLCVCEECSAANAPCCLAKAFYCLTLYLCAVCVQRWAESITSLG